MRRNYGAALRLAHNCLWLCMLGLFLESCLVHSDEPFQLWTALYLLPIILYSFLADAWAKHSWSILLVQIPTLAGALVLGSLTGKSVTLVLVTAVMVFCLLAQHRSPLFGPLCPGIPMLVYFAVLYFLGLFYGNTAFLTAAWVGLMGEMLIFLLHENQEGLSAFLDVRQNLRAVPYSQIRKTNGLMLGGILLILVLLFACSSLFLDNSPLIALGTMLLGWIRAMLRRLFSGDDAVTADPTPGFTEELPTISDAASEIQQSPLGNGETSPVLDVLAWILLGCILAALAVLVLRSLWKLLLSLTKKKPAAKSVQEESVDEIVDLTEELSVKTVGMRPGRDEAGRIRRTYRRKIRQHRFSNKRHGPVNPAFNPSQIETDSVYVVPLTEEEKRFWEQLHKQYEQARYDAHPKSSSH
jgi:hypothetical protein